MLTDTQKAELRVLLQGKYWNAVKAVYAILEAEWNSEKLDKGNIHAIAKRAISLQGRKDGVKTLFARLEKEAYGGRKKSDFKLIK